MDLLNDVIYDGFGFIANGCVLTNIDHLTLAPRNNQLETRANRNGAVLVQSQLGVKPIYIEGYYTGDTPTDAQLMYDTLAQALNRQERLLTIPHAGSTRRYTATPTNVILREPDGLNRLTFSFEFVVPEGQATALSDTTIINQTVTTASATIPLTIAGSVKARPLITLTYTTVTGGTNKTVSIRNSRDFVGLTIQRDWVSGDTVVIDSANFQIYINGVLTAPNGRMPTWETGAGALFYSDTLTTRSVNILGTHKIGNL
jgi:phage-related protein